MLPYNIPGVHQPAPKPQHPSIHLHPNQQSGLYPSQQPGLRYPSNIVSPTVNPSVYPNVHQSSYGPLTQSHYLPAAQPQPLQRSGMLPVSQPHVQSLHPSMYPVAHPQALSTRPVLSQSHVNPPVNYAAPVHSSQFVGNSPVLQKSGVNASQSQIIGSRVVQSGPAIQGGVTSVEYVPYERQVVESVAVERTEYVPVEKRYTDYFAVENMVEYVPISTFETIQELIPYENTEYVPQQKVNYIPQIKTEMVPVNKVQEKTEYVAQEIEVVKYPEYEGQFVREAEISARMLAGSQLVGRQVVAAPQDYPSYMGSNWQPSQSQVYAGNQVYAGVHPSQSQYYAGVEPSQNQVYVQQIVTGYGAPVVNQNQISSATLKSPASVQEKYLLKKLEKDIRKLEAESKVERSQSHSPGMKNKHSKKEDDGQYVQDGQDGQDGQDVQDVQDVRPLDQQEQPEPQPLIESNVEKKVDELLG